MVVILRKNIRTVLKYKHSGMNLVAILVESHMTNASSLKLVIFEWQSSTIKFHIS